MELKLGLLQSRIHKQMLSENVYINLSVTVYVRVMLKAHPPIKEFQVQNIMDTSLLHHMQLKLLFIVHCVFHREHGFSNMI